MNLSQKALPIGYCALQRKVEDCLSYSGGYGFELREMSGLRNRLAHAYGTVDMGIVWDVLEIEFPKLAEGCKRYCDERGIDLMPTWK